MPIFFARNVFTSSSTIEGSGSKYSACVSAKTPFATTPSAETTSEGNGDSFTFASSLASLKRLACFFAVSSMFRNPFARLVGRFAAPTPSASTMETGTSAIASAVSPVRPFASTPQKPRVICASAAPRTTTVPSAASVRSIHASLAHPMTRFWSALASSGRSTKSAPHAMSALSRSVASGTLATEAMASSSDERLAVPPAATARGTTLTRRETRRIARNPAMGATARAEATEA